MQRTVSDYVIVSSGSVSNLNALVMKRIREGWHLQGGVSATSVGSNDFFHQAMVKYEPAGGRQHWE